MDAVHAHPVEHAVPDQRFARGGPGGALNRRGARFRLELPSDARLAARVARDLAEAGAAASGIGADAEFRLRLALAEAVDNAVRHGNRGDPARLLRLRVEAAPGVVRVSVADEGRGFDVQACPDPTTGEARRGAGGRGLFLMRRLADRVRHQDGGSRVSLVVGPREGSR